MIALGAEEKLRVARAAGGCWGVSQDTQESYYLHTPLPTALLLTWVVARW